MSTMTAPPAAAAVVPERHAVDLAAPEAVPSPNSGAIGVMLLVSSLEHGGAERQVLELYRALDRRHFSPVICSLSDYVPLAQQLPDVRRDLVIIQKRWKYDATTVARLGRVVRERGIALVHAFLFDAEMTARVARRLGLVRVVISSERNSDYSLGPFKSGCLRLTRTWFDAMIANSAAGKRFNAEAFGVAPHRIHVVRNGIDVARFQPTDGAAIRTALGVPPGAPLVSMIASFKRQKRHEDFFRVARLVLDRNPDARFMCVGEPLRDNEQGAGDYHREMRQLVDALNLRDRMIFAGPQQDMPAVYSACDITVLTSSREGTPNALLESMACAVPVVATAVGDNAIVVPDGRTGFIVKPGDVGATAERVDLLLRDPALRARMGTAARTWVVQEFSTAALARRTEAVYGHALRRAGLGAPITLREEEPEAS